MAVAEARAAWQRTANRCFVQEDAKRAPKLACCPSTSSPSKQLDAGPVNPAEGQDNPTPGFVPPNRNPSYSNLPPDSRWWLQMQPDYGHQRGLTNEQLNTLDVEMETSKHSGARLKNDEDGGPSVYAHNRIFDTCIKKQPEDKMQDLKAVYNKDAQESLKVKDVDEPPFELIEMDPIGCVVLKKQDELCFECDSPWAGGEKTEPWWRKADRDELASFVAQRSLDHIENCDLPQPQNTHVKMDPFAHIGGFDGNGIGIFHPSKDYMPRCVSLPNPIVHKQSNLTSGSERGKKWASVEGYSQFATDKPISDFTSHKGTTEMHIYGNDPSKAQLLEALRHSQTRAREAEKAAQQAYAEKEDILKLFFRQASHLFAYKQWFQLLQLENFYFQIKNNKDQLASGLGLLPLLPHKTRKLKKNSQKPAKGKRAKRSRARYDIFSKYAVFALGLSLVGAGLLLGWTVGWMFPAL